MFAPKVAKEQTKAAENPKSTLASRRSLPAGHQLGHDLVERALFLQRTIGNQATRRLLARQTSRPTVSHPPSDHEQEGGAAENTMAAETSRSASWDFSKTPLFPAGRASPEPSVHEAPPIVHEVLRSPGQPLDSSTRAVLQPLFHHDFARVRIHADTKAAESARSVSALAYTVGHDIVFASGQYAPDSQAGLKLLAHELAHTLQQRESNTARVEMSSAGDAAEREADAVAHAVMSAQSAHITQSSDGRLARQASTAAPLQQPAGPGTAKPPMTRDDFEEIMKERYRVQSVRKGTFRQQQVGDLKESDWHDWDPGVSSTTYSSILAAFDLFETYFGGVPPVKHIVFFRVHYNYDKASGRVTEDPRTLASYSFGILMIYQGVSGSVAAPVGTMIGDYLRHPGEIFSRPTTEEQAVRRNITHELGHGILEIAVDHPPSGAGQDPKLLDDYRMAVGWTKGGQLFDIQAPGVEKALEHNIPPPGDALITEQTWYLAKWKERPITQYMVHGPDEDFAEAIMAYVNEPDALRSLSPARYKFINERKAQWAPSAQKRINVWEATKMGGQPRTLEHSWP